MNFTSGLTHEEEESLTPKVDSKMEEYFLLTQKEVSNFYPTSACDVQVPVVTHLFLSLRNTIHPVFMQEMYYLYLSIYLKVYL